MSETNQPDPSEYVNFHPGGGEVGKFGKLVITLDFDAQSIQYNYSKPVLISKIVPNVETNFLVHPYVVFGFRQMLELRYKQFIEKSVMLGPDGKPL